MHDNFDRVVRVRVFDAIFFLVDAVIDRLYCFYSFIVFRSEYFAQVEAAAEFGGMHWLPQFGFDDTEARADNRRVDAIVVGEAGVPSAGDADQPCADLLQNALRDDLVGLARGPHLSCFSWRSWACIPQVEAVPKAAQHKLAEVFVHPALSQNLKYSRSKRGRYQVGVFRRVWSKDCRVFVISEGVAKSLGGLGAVVCGQRPLDCF